MQSAICLDRACHRIAESQIGLLRNSRETRMRPLVAPQFLTFTPPPPSLQRPNCPSKHLWRCLTRRILDSVAKPVQPCQFFINIRVFCIPTLPGGKNFALSATLTLATIYFASRLDDLGGNLFSPRGIQERRDVKFFSFVAIVLNG